MVKIEITNQDGQIRQVELYAETDDGAMLHALLIWDVFGYPNNRWLAPYWNG